MKIIKLFVLTVLLFILIGCPSPHPYANDDFVSVLKNNSIVIDVLNNDMQLDYPDSYSVVIKEYPEQGSVVVNHDNSITYTSHQGYIGTDTFTYNIIGIRNDRESIYDGGIVTVTVKEENSAPVAVNDYVIVVKNDGLTILPLINDEDVDNDHLFITSVEEPNHGIIYFSEGTRITYHPDKNFLGTDCIVYTMSDGIESSNASICFTVKEENTKPVANDDYITINKTNIDDFIKLNVLENDTDEESDFYVTFVEQPKYGRVWLQNGDIHFKPDNDFVGEIQFTYTLTDWCFGVKATVYITIVDE